MGCASPGLPRDMQQVGGNQESSLAIPQPVEDQGEYSSVWRISIT